FKYDLPVLLLCLQPHTTLTTLYKPVVRFFVVTDGFQYGALINQMRVLLFPVVSKHTELLNDLTFCVSYRHFYPNKLITLFSFVMKKSTSSLVLYTAKDNLT